VTSLYYLFRDAPQRRAALALPVGSPPRYALYGLDQLAERGYAIRHNLERQGPSPVWARATGAAIKRALEAARVGDVAGVEAAREARDAEDTERYELAREVGLKVCSANPG